MPTGNTAGSGFNSPMGGPTEYRAKGLRFGSNQFHPSLSLEFGYDNNVFYSSGEGATAGVFAEEDLKGSVYLAIKPVLFLGNMLPGQVQGVKGRAIEYSILLGFEYKRYLQDLGARTEKNFYGAQASASAMFFSSSKVSFEVMDSFVRTTEPRALVNNLNYDRDHNEVGVGVFYRPGGGLLEFRLGYRFVVDFFEDQMLAMANYYAHDIELKGKWKFFPQTAWWLTVNWRYIHYWEQNIDPAVQNMDSMPLRAMTGMTGRLAPTLTLNVGAGYGYSFYDHGPNYKYGILGMADLSWQIGPYINLRAGYLHGFEDSLWANYYMKDTAYVSYAHQFINRLLLGVSFRWLMAVYDGGRLATGATSPHCNTEGNCERTDHIFQLMTTLKYYFLDWLSLGGGYQLLINSNKYYEIHTSPTGEQYRRDAKWVKHIAFIEITAAF